MFQTFEPRSIFTNSGTIIKISGVTFFHHQFEKHRWWYKNQTFICGTVIKGLCGKINGFTQVCNLAAVFIAGAPLQGHGVVGRVAPRSKNDIFGDRHHSKFPAINCIAAQLLESIMAGFQRINHLRACIAGLFFKKMLDLIEGEWIFGSCGFKFWWKRIKGRNFHRDPVFKIKEGKCAPAFYGSTIKANHSGCLINIFEGKVGSEIGYCFFRRSASYKVFDSPHFNREWGRIATNPHLP